MANLESAKKRVRQNERNRVRNRVRKSRVKTEIRKLTDALRDGEVQVAQDQLGVVSKILDRTASQGTIHRNTAARRKSRLARRINKARAAAKPE